MTQFVKLNATDGSSARVNVASISRYYPSPQNPRATSVELSGGGLFVVAHSVTDLDDLIRNSDKDAVVSGS